jgi:hypothetical protein
MRFSVHTRDKAKIQAQVLVPLIKAMQAELGEARANALVCKALGETYRRYGEEFWRARREEDLGNAMASAFAQFARGDVRRSIGCHRAAQQRVVIAIFSLDDRTGN